MKNTFKNIPPTGTAYTKNINPQEGQTFVPYKSFYGALLPDALMRTSTLTATEKICWAKLNQFAGKNGFCFPSLRALAQSLGISVRQVNRVIKGLVDKRFIARQSPDNFQKGQYRSTRYSFLWHTCFNDSPAKPSGQPSDLMSSISPPDDTGVLPSHDISDLPPNVKNGSPGDINCDPDDMDCAPPDVKHVVHANGADGTLKGSYIKDHREEDHRKEKGDKHDRIRIETSDAAIPSNESPPSESFVHGVDKNEMTTLLKRYSPAQQKVIRDGITCLKASRKNGIIPDDVILAERKRWNTIDPASVVQGIQIYIKNKFHLKNKNVHYLWGIIRNISKSTTDQDDPGPQRPFPHQNKEAFRTCMEWLQETTGRPS